MEKIRKILKEYKLELSLFILSFSVLITNIGLFFYFKKKEVEYKKSIAYKEELLKSYRKRLKSLDELKSKLNKLNNSLKKYFNKSFNAKNEALAFSLFQEYISSLEKRYSAFRRNFSKLSPVKIGNGIYKLRLFVQFSFNDLKNMLEFIYNIESQRNKLTGFDRLTIRLDQRKERNNFILEAEVFGIWIQKR